MHFAWFSLFVFIHSVICINESDIQSDVQRTYSVNHPPSAEEINPIPVSVVYEEDIEVKPHIPKYFDISVVRDVEKKISTTERSQSLAPKEIQEISNIKTDSQPEDKLVSPAARGLGEFQIPVAVIYDTLPDKNQNPRAEDKEETSLRRRKLKRVSRRKPLQNKTTAENDNLTNQSTQPIGLEGLDKSKTQLSKLVKPQLRRTESVKPQIENDDSVKSETPRTKPVTPQLSRTESANPRIDNNDSLKSETQRTKPVKPQLSRIESAKPHIVNEDSLKSKTQRTKPAKPQVNRTESGKPPIENEGSVKSDARSTKPVLPQRSRSESVKPRRMETARQSSSNLETISNVEKTKRVRDPVVPIVEMENYVYGHSGNFHYSYEGGDGTKAHSEGQLKSIDQAAGEAVSGGFSYTDKDGNDFSLSYTADEHGYRPIGAHLPTPPPIPPAIARALAYLATATTPEPVTKPSENHAKDHFETQNVTEL